jgi:hypothetical protein
MMFKDGVRAYLPSITKPEHFILHSLEGKSMLKINFPPDISFKTFSSMPMFTTLLEKAVKEKKSYYLKPAFPDHPSFDFYLYLPNINWNRGRLFFVQVAYGIDHPIAISGCLCAQTALTHTTSLEHFQPLKDHKWDIVFIVPEDTAAPFHQQRFKVLEGTPFEKKKDMIDTWDSRTTQYVLKLQVQWAMGVADSSV